MRELIKQSVLIIQVTLLVGNYLNTHIESNLPTDYLYVDKDNFLDLKVYEDLGKSSNLVVGTVSTLLLGPVGLLGFSQKEIRNYRLCSIFQRR